MEREVGGGIGMGSTCKPMADSFQCMAKSTTIKKKCILHVNMLYSCYLNELNKQGFLNFSDFVLKSSE